MTTVIICSLITLLVCLGVGTDGLTQPTLIESAYPLYAGFQRIFNLASYGSPALPLLVLPGIFLSGHCFVFAYGRQVYAMSRSGLLPSVLSLTSARFGTPYVAIIMCSVLGYLLCAIGRWVRHRSAAHRHADRTRIDAAPIAEKPMHTRAL
jgi:ethanolamine permease